MRRTKMRRFPSAPLGSKIADKAVLRTTVFVASVAIYEQAPIATYTTKATQMSGFVCDFVSLVGVDGFECRVNISIGASSVRAKPELTAN